MMAKGLTGGKSSANFTYFPTQPDQAIESLNKTSKYNWKQCSNSLFSFVSIDLNGKQAARGMMKQLANSEKELVMKAGENRFNGARKMSRFQEYPRRIWTWRSTGGETKID